jgi:acyl-homoserine lactone acylase PvdQ
MGREDFLWYGSSYAPSYRTRRLQALLSEAHQEGGKSSAKDNWEWLSDTYDLVAEIWTPLFVEALEKEGAGELAALLRSYDFNASREQVAPKLFALFWREFVKDTYFHALGGDLAFSYLRESGLWADRLESYLERGDKSLWEKGGSLDETLARVARLVVAHWREQAKSQETTWGDVHYVEFQTEKGSIFVPLGGSSYTVSFAPYDILGEDFQVDTVQSLLFLADLSNDQTFKLVLPGGVREAYSRKGSKNQLKAWSEHYPLEVGLSESAVDARAVLKWRALPMKN